MGNKKGVSKKKKENILDVIRKQELEKKKSQGKRIGKKRTTGKGKSRRGRK